MTLNTRTRLGPHEIIGSKAKPSPIACARGPLPVEEALAIAKQILDALALAQLGNQVIGRSIGRLVDWIEQLIDGPIQLPDYQITQLPDTGV